MRSCALSMMRSVSTILCGRFVSEPFSTLQPNQMRNDAGIRSGSNQPEPAKMWSLGIGIFDDDAVAAASLKRKRVL